MRAALLPTPGDPHMLAYWLDNYATWREHVDELVVLVNGPGDHELARALVEAQGGRFVFTSERLGHDGALRFLINSGTSAQYVVLCEDDAYVRHPEAVGAAFASIEAETIDLIGSPRHEDYAGQYQEWGAFDADDPAEFRHGLWPAFLFARRDDLLRTDQQYGDLAWRIGETIEGIGVVTAEDCAYVGVSPDHVHLDTLFGTTFQLRARGLRTELIHHVRLFDAQAAEEWIVEDPPWFHVTGLSTLDQALSGGPIPDLDDRGGLWTRRVAWWQRTGVDMAEFIVRTGIRQSDLDAWSRRFDAWEAQGARA